MKTHTLKHILSTTLYTILLILVLDANNYGLSWLIEKVIDPIFIWFYYLGWFWKWALISIGAPAIVFIILNFFKTIGFFINTIICKFFLYNKVALWISIILCISNIIYIELNLIDMLNWNFWVIVYWIILSVFVISTNVVFIFIGNETNEVDSKENYLEEKEDLREFQFWREDIVKIIDDRRHKNLVELEGFYIKNLKIPIPLNVIFIMIERMEEMKQINSSFYAIYRDCEDYLYKTDWFIQLSQDKKNLIRFDFHKSVILGIDDAISFNSLTNFSRERNQLLMDK